MKSSLSALAIAFLVIVPALSFAETPVPLTRMQVRQHLIELEQTGYRPGEVTNIHYPDDIQAAEARLATTEKEPRADDDLPAGASFADR